MDGKSKKGSSIKCNGCLNWTPRIAGHKNSITRGPIDRFVVKLVVFKNTNGGKTPKAKV